jgi:hypothetical protein
VPSGSVQAVKLLSHVPGKSTQTGILNCTSSLFAGGIPHVLSVARAVSAKTVVARLLAERTRAFEEVSACQVHSAKQQQLTVSTVYRDTQLTLEIWCRCATAIAIPCTLVASDGACLPQT